ncbi:MAG: hypothetical protein PCFJNLEI_01372 [Verrucomicrobiae bacterium]|nr:hypothetical protein [Verrucomicrobiae bacterium]
MNEKANLGELLDFLRENNEKAKTRNPGLFALNARIAYFHATKTNTFQTKVFVEPDSWKDPVQLVETDECPSSIYHLAFNLKFQTMKFDRESNALVITGNSEKMGKYQVTIVAM